MEMELTKQLKSYLTFKLHDELFALEVEKVIEILEVPKITHIPKAPEYMKGVINLRGQVLPLIDTCIKFGLAPIKPDVNTCIIVIDLEMEDKTVRFGALVNQVLEVLEIEADKLQPSPSLETNYNLEFIKGILRAEEEFIIVLNIDSTFSVEEVETLDQSRVENTLK